MPADSPAVCVAVVVKDRRELMARCLDGLARQEVPGGFEIVVVDNGSTDGTLELLHERAAGSPVPMRVRSDPGSIGRIRNLAVAEARAPVIAFTDSDCVPTPGWLATLVAPFADPGAGRIGVVQGCTRPDPGAPRTRFDATQDLSAFTGRYETCNIAYRVEALRGAGGFDESIGFFGEDTSAGLAVRRAGWDATFASDAIVHHAVVPAGLAWHLRRAYGYGNINALVRRHPELRDQLWHRYFLRPRNAAFAAAAAGLATAVVTRRAGPALLAVPYAWLRRPKGRRQSDLLDAAGGVAFDAAVFAGLVRGSLRERTLVL